MIFMPQKHLVLKQLALDSYRIMSKANSWQWDSSCLSQNEQTPLALLR